MTSPFHYHRLLFLDMPFLYLHNNRIDPTQTECRSPLSRFGKFSSYFIHLNLVLNGEANLKSLFCSLCFFSLFEDYHIPWYWQSSLHFSEKWHENSGIEQSRVESKVVQKANRIWEMRIACHSKMLRCFMLTCTLYSVHNKLLCT